MNYYASARAAAGVDAEALSVPAGSSLADVITVLSERHPQRLPRVLTAASFLVDGVAATRRTAEVADGAQVDVLPPFAGG